MSVHIEFTINSDPAYAHTVSIGETYELIYREHERTAGEASVGFGSLDEMEQVAKTMLTAVAAARTAAKG